LRPERRRAAGPLLWLAVLVLAAGLVATRAQGPWLNTDLLDLLPGQTLPPGAQALSERYQRRFATQTLWLIPADTGAHAAEQARVLRQTLATSGLFHDIGPSLDAGAMRQRYQALYRYRFNLLAEADQAALDQQRPQALIDQALARVFGPFGVSGGQLSGDPLFLFERYLQSLAPLALELDGDIPLTRHDQRYWSLTVASLAGNGFSLADQSRLLALTERLQQRWPALRFTGVPLYSAAGADSARREISTIGSVSLIAVVVLFLALFASPRPMLLALLSVASGVLCGLAACLALFAQLNLLTLVFGASLIGVAVDYSVHFFCHRFAARESAWRTRQRLAAPLALALISSVLGYLAMGLAAFPGLRQVAVFSAAGLTGAWLTVMVVLPALSGALALPPRQRLLAAAHRWRLHWPGLLRRGRWPLALLALLLAAGALRLHGADDVRRFQSPPPWLEAQTSSVQAILPGGASQYLIVHGDDESQWWQREHQLVKSLQARVRAGTLDDFRALSQGWRPAAEQQRTHQQLGAGLYQQPRLAAYLQRLGFGQPAIEAQRQAWRDAAGRELALRDWLRALGDDGLSAQWGGCHANGCTSLVSLGGLRHPAALAALDNPAGGVYFVDRAGRLSDTFATLRQHLGLLLIAAYLLSGVVLALARGPRRALSLLGVPALASLLTLGALGWLGGGISLINVVALYLVLGIGIDYAIFCAQPTQQHGAGGAALAVLVSALTTGLSFGLLSLSSTRLVHDFGLTLLIGILGALLLAPLLSRPPAAPSEDTTRP
tara:strand:- start:28605 stop:30941 length:2337 start_codon:yes stop_codon:yes gene_type:complete